MNVQTSEETAPSGSGEGRQSGTPTVRRWSRSDGQIGSVLSCGADIWPGGYGDPPYYSVGAVSTDQGDYVLHRDDLLAFWQVHAEATVQLFDAAPFLVAVERASGFDFGPLMDAGRITDLRLVARLRELAVRGKAPKRASGLRRLLGAEEPDSSGLTAGESTAGPPGSADEGEEEALWRARAIRRLSRTILPEVEQVARSHGSSDSLLGQRRWVRAEWALAHITERGICLDAEVLDRLQAAGISEMATSEIALLQGGYQPGPPPADDDTLEALRRSALKRPDGHLHLRPLGWRPLSGKRPDHTTPSSCIDHAFRYKFFPKLMKWLAGLLFMREGCVYPTYRLSSKGWPTAAAPDIQSFPPGYGLHQLFVPSEGHVFLIADFAGLHLSRLAEYCSRRHGQRSVPPCFWAGEDVFAHIAASALSKPIREVTPLDREKAAVTAFAAPRDMREKATVRCALLDYGVAMTVKEAKRFERAVQKLFPKAENFLKANGNVDAFRDRFDLSDSPRGRKHAAHLLVRVLGGHAETNFGRVFAQEEIDWAWTKAAEIAEVLGRSDLLAEIGARRGSADLLRHLRPPPTVVLGSGRVYGGLTFCQSRRIFIDGACNDAVGEALYGLVRAGIRVCAIHHSHFVIELSRHAATLKEVEQVATIILQSMRQVLPWVPVRLDCRFAERWDSLVFGSDFSCDAATGQASGQIFSFLCDRTGSVHVLDSNGCQPPLTRYAATMT